MGLLVAGVVLWSLVHLSPALVPGARDAMVTRIGEQAFKGLFAGTILIALVLMVVGWRNTAVDLVYVPPIAGGPIVPLLMFVSFYLLAAANAPGNTKRLLRHPMLLGTIVWAFAHLLANGENRSVVLFGGLGLWALAEIIMINRRDISYSPPDPVPASRELITVVATVIVYTVFLYLHRLLFGVSPVPGLFA